MIAYDRRFSLMLSGTALSALIACSMSPEPSQAADAVTAAGPQGPDMGALARDLTLTRNTGGRMVMVMWMPDEFWRAAFKVPGNLPSETIERYVGVIHPYVLLAVVDAQRGITAFRYADTAAVTGETTIEDSRGISYKPLDPEAQDDEIRNLTQMMRPVLANMMGAVGQHMEFLVFANLDKSGNTVADAKATGALVVHVGDVAMSYRLPIGSVLPPVVDAKTGEWFPGNFKFNPYTGSKLIPAPTASPAPAASTGPAAGKTP
jgi:hypothetical protein